MVISGSDLLEVLYHIYIRPYVVGIFRLTFWGYLHFHHRASTNGQVCDFLETLQLDPAVIDKFRAEAVDGRVLCEVSDEDLSGRGGTATGHDGVKEGIHTGSIWIHICVIFKLGKILKIPSIVFFCKLDTRDFV